MSFSDLLARMKFSRKDAEVIFDRHEPIGTPTDMVMPRRRRKNLTTERVSDLTNSQSSVVKSLNR